MRSSLTRLTPFNSTLGDFSRFIQTALHYNLLFPNSLVAQIDSQSNLDVAKNSASIARASKRDSSAMKAIAVITAFFLPGTFIAVIDFAFVFIVSCNLLTLHCMADEYYQALFSMPFFDWSSNQVILPHFYIYWAFTGPLTVLVHALHAAWTWFKIVQHANEDGPGGYGLSSSILSSAKPSQSPICEPRSPIRTARDQTPLIEEVIGKCRGQTGFQLATPYHPSRLQTAQHLPS